MIYHQMAEREGIILAFLHKRIYFKKVRFVGMPDLGPVSPGRAVLIKIAPPFPTPGGKPEMKLQYILVLSKKKKRAIMENKRSRCLCLRHGVVRQKMLILR